VGRGIQQPHRLVNQGQSGLHSRGRSAYGGLFTDRGGPSMESAAFVRAPLMFIHGAWLSSQSWKNFTHYFGQRGFPVSAPEWPRKEGKPLEELREDSGEIAGLGLTEIVDHYEAEIR